MENAVLQMLETWLSKERWISNSTPRFLTDEKELTEQLSSVRQCSITCRVFVLSENKISEFSSRELLVIQLFYINNAFCKFFKLVCFVRRDEICDPGPQNQSGVYL